MKKLLSLLLVLLLTLSLCPPPARAAEVWDGSVDISWYDPEKTEFTLSTPAELAGLAALVNGMTDPKCPKLIGDAGLLQSIRLEGVMLVGAGGGNVSDTVYTSPVDFAGKTVRLTADLDMGGVYDAAAGSWSGPNWTPIGGKFPMLPEEAAGDCLTLDTRFNGVLDGQGHTISNLYCDRFARKGFPYSMAIGVVGFLGGATDGETGVTGQFEDGWQPAVRNLVLAGGSILGRRMVGGIVGRVGQTSGGVVIENCANRAAVKSTDAKGVGGIVGAGWGKGVIRGCYNAGPISTTYSSPAGGIIGSNEGLDIYNCYNAARIDSNGNQRGRGIGSHDTGSYTVDNCFYLAGCGDDPAAPGYYMGLSTKIRVSVTELSEAELKSAAILQRLNANGAVFAADTGNLNGGLPVLWFEAGGGSGSCTVTVTQAAGGTVRLKGESTVPFGETVTLLAETEPGYTLEYFTVNGQPIASDFFTATADAAVSAVFTKLGVVTITIPESRDYYAAVAREGWKLVNGELVWTERELLRSGDTLLQGNILTVLTHGYEDASPADMDLEYIDAFVSTLSGTEKNADGTYTVTGRENVTVSVSRRTQPKSWVRYADASWYLAGGRQEVYVLTTAEQLAGLAWLVDKGGYTFEGVTVALGNDISLDNTDGTVGVRCWTPIGTNVSKSFRGTFDGQGHAVYDMTVRATGSYGALFGCCVGATIKNLSVYGSVRGEANASYAAGVAAYVSGGRVENCVNWAEISAAGTHAGGVAALLRDGAVMEGCFNYGAVTAGSGAGGLVGVSDSGEDRILRSANFGPVTAEDAGSYGCGGLAGRLSGAAEACANYGPVGGNDRYTGGLAGYANAKNSSALTLCVNHGAVSSANTVSTAALGGLAGYGQYLILAASENRGSVTPGPGFPAANAGEEVGREGTLRRETAEGELPAFEAGAPRSFPTAEKENCTVTFTADGAIVAAVPYRAGAQAVQEPAVPEKEGFVGYWDNYRPGSRDITVRAVYRPRLVRDGDVIERDGTWFITWFSAGEIRLAAGVSAVLDGANGGETGFDGLSLIVERGASLTLRNVTLNGEKTLLTLMGGNTLTLAGENRLLSRADAPENAAPALRAAGELTIDGEGSLFVTGGVRNSAVLAEAGTVELKSGTLTVYKEDLLGFTGGAFHAPEAKLVIAGGVFKGHTVSDNVAVICAAETELRGGRLLLEAERSPAAVLGPVRAAGGEIAARSHDGNSAATANAYAGAASLPGYSGTAAFTELLPFTDVFLTDPYYEAVAACYEQGIFNGTSAVTFSPETSMTRAMFVTVLYRLAGQPAAAEPAPFTDLRQDWYKDAVAWAVAEGITRGTSETAFSPDSPVTREQTAVFLFRYAQKRGEQLPRRHESVSHGALSAWAEAEALWALSGGLFDGVREPLTAPTDFAPRSLLATVVSNYAIYKR